MIWGGVNYWMLMVWSDMVGFTSAYRLKHSADDDDDFFIFYARLKQLCA